MAEIEGEHFQTREQENRASFDQQVEELSSKISELNESLGKQEISSESGELHSEAGQAALKEKDQKVAELLLLAKEGAAKGYVEVVERKAQDYQQRKADLQQRGFESIAMDNRDTFYWHRPGTTEGKK